VRLVPFSPFLGFRDYVAIFFCSDSVCISSLWAVSLKVWRALTQFLTSPGALFFMLPFPSFPLTPQTSHSTPRLQPLSTQFFSLIQTCPSIRWRWRTARELDEGWYVGRSSDAWYPGSGFNFTMPLTKTDAVSTLAEVGCAIIDKFWVHGLGF